MTRKSGSFTDIHIQHGKIQMSERCFSTPGRGTGISSPVRVYTDSRHTAKSPTSPSSEVAMMDVIFTPEFQTRFWLKVKVGGIEECWDFLGAKHRGYGVIHVKGYKSQIATRIAYRLFHSNDLADDKVIDHLCRNPSCVNPHHLEAVSTKENVLRGIGPSALNAQKTHCISNHYLGGSNLLIGRNGKRTCKECGRRRALAYARTARGREMRAAYKKAMREQKI
jgi:HNH endonuclease